MMMEEKELKIAFLTGGLSSAIVVPAPMNNGFILTIRKKHAKDESDISLKKQQRTKKDELRIFKTIEGAISAGRRIGFRKFTVELSTLKK
jgi:hypothetical protein